MNWLNELVQGEPEAAKLHRMRLHGLPLPERLPPNWVRHASPNRVGLYRLPPMSLSDTWHGFNFSPIIGLLFLGFGAGFLGLFVWCFSMLFQPGGGPGWLLLLLGAGFGLSGATLWQNWWDARHLMLETASLTVVPGEHLLVLFRKPRVGALPIPLLACHERTYGPTDQQPSWGSELLHAKRLQFTEGDGAMLALRVAIPADALGSYDTPTYKLQWSIGLEYRPWYGGVRTDYFVFWVERP